MTGPPEEVPDMADLIELLVAAVLEGDAVAEAAVLKLAFYEACDLPALVAVPALAKVAVLA